MSTTAIVWIIVIVVVVLVLALVAVRMSGKKKTDRRREQASEIREEAVSDERTVRKHEAEAAEKEALARQAQAEADRKAAAADRLNLEAQERSEHATGARAEQRDRLARADEIDPDVTDRRTDDADHGDHGHGVGRHDVHGDQNLADGIGHRDRTDDSGSTRARDL